ncbi:hypothetical protein [Sulfitobacter sp. PS-8MA]|uniref:hypothetical protein n=1 Tax=Sulfitobacter sp. PS-8MA TaxID=3237707 RepID=UPI0034C5CE4C
MCHKPIFTPIALGLTLAFCLSATADAAPLYLGTEEYETDDRAVMSAIIEHCRGLQGEGEAAETTDREDAEEGAESTGDGEAGEGEPFAASRSITADRLASGEGTGETPDLSAVTAQDCAAAGIIY